MKKIVAMRSHQSMFATGWGTLGNQLPLPQKNTPGLSMVPSEYGVEVSATGKVSFIVPWANVVVAEFVEAAEEAKKAK